MGGNKKNKAIKKGGKIAKNSSRKQLTYKPSKILEKHSSNKPKKKQINVKGLVIGIIAIVAIMAVLVIVNHKSYEEYDLKGLTIKEACEKARGVGWKVDSIHHIESYSDKTDCYNTNIIVTNYYYSKYDHSVDIYFGEKKTEEEKQAECETSDKWYRDGQCKTQEEWEDDYAWKNAHAACKKYGSSGYAKTLTDCYIGDEYKGPVNGETIDNSTSDSTSGSSTSNNNTSWRQVLASYEAWMNRYIDFMVKYKNTSDYSALASMMGDYSALLSEMTEWTEKLDNVKSDLSTADLTEYLQTLTRINQRLSELY